jgi:hypothetical protein
MNKYSDKAVRSKPLSKMSPEEKALLFMEAERAAEVLRGRYKGEANTMKAISALLAKEADRLEEQERIQEQPKPSPVRFGEEKSFNLFDEGNNH